MTAIKAPTATTVLKEASREMVHQSAGDLAGYLLDRIGPGTPPSVSGSPTHVRSRLGAISTPARAKAPSPTD